MGQNSLWWGRPAFGLSYCVSLRCPGIVLLSLTESTSVSINISGVKVRTANGSELDLGARHGQVLLIVNVASRCGFTRQYAGLQALQEQYGAQGFAVLGFPCNDFGAQEPGSLPEIQQFCSTTYGASFELFDKVHATGAKTEPYATLTQAEPAGDVAWNFEKFLIGKDGTVLARFKSNVEPDAAELTAAIEAALAA
ncbi:Thioredoxin/glutathione peroxidase BtuE [Synechococcus sp. CBW1107]|nr:Thioredoxin/glutathione peroxidase BtuE [Synechococcus sp. CBW1107]